MERNHLFQTEKQAIQLSSKTALIEKLEYYYRIVSATVLAKQHPVSGLLPASTAVNSHGNYLDAWVRDNVYSILCVHGLALAYRRLDDDHGRCYELEHSVVKLMRGLLFAMMKQAAKVELFKNKQSIDNCLHAKYSTSTGDTVVGDREWGHLQLDATSIFLLALAEMTASGLQIIFTLDEVDFVQNLVFYIERTYRTPDYGIWERGNKINHGMPELNSSSIGMAVAALQAINGTNLFGPKGGPDSVIHVLPDEITRNFTTVHSALPRESLSKEVDAATLSIIGYPAFAIHDKKLLHQTRQEIITKLQGVYGCKRFLRDGHQTIPEDTSRLHYEPHELKIFEHIECEWPLFFTYLILDGLFNGDFESVEFYRKAMKSCIVYSDNIPNSTLPPGIPLVPEVFIVPQEAIQAEKTRPHSQKRVPNDNVPLVWAESLFVLGELMYEGLLSPAELDPLGRHQLPTYRSSQKLDTVVQVVLLAEDAALQARLATFGLETQTLDQIAPITISTPSCLKNAYSALGANTKLNLSGRPSRPIGTLATCKLYRIQGRIFAFTPHFMDKEEFYLNADSDYLVSIFENEILFVRDHWYYTGRPTMVVLLTHSIMGSLKQSNFRNVTTLPETDPFSPTVVSKTSMKGFMDQSLQRKKLYNFIMSLRRGVFNGVRVRLGRLQEMVATSCIESLDFLDLKLSKGYLMKDGKKLNYQDILLSIDRLAKSGDSKLLTVKQNSARNAETEALQRTFKRRPSDLERSPFLSPTMSSAPPPHEYKLKTEGLDSSQRPVTPFRFSAKNSALETYGGSHSGPSAPSISRQSSGSAFITLGNAEHLEQAISQLSVSNNIHDHIELLDYINSCKGLDFMVSIKDVGLVSVRELLEEIYQRSLQLKLWSVVRQSAGILRKVVNSLTINLTDLLIRQKQVTIGFGSKEHTVSTPMSPDSLTEIINSHCRSDARESPLIQEIMTYLGTFIRSEPHLFDGILRLRIHYIVIAMREEISRIRSCDEHDALEFIMKLSPDETKSLLGYVLSARYQISDTEKQEGFSNDIPVTPATECSLRIQSGGYYDGNFCSIELNDKLITDIGGRGINMVSLNSDDGTVEYNQFDTHISNEESDDFAKLIESLEPGTVVALVVKEDCLEQLTEAAKLACESLGSAMIRSYCYRDSWCMIGFKGAKVGTILESLKKAKQGPSSILEKTFDKVMLDEQVRVSPDLPFMLPNNGKWLRRRKIDGALQRTPVGFYPKVHSILEKSGNGIVINGYILPRDPTVSEKTPEETNFALQVESLLNSVQDAAERQIAVECLTLLSEFEKRNPNLRLGHGSNALDIINIIKESYAIFWEHYKQQLSLSKSLKGEVMNALKTTTIQNNEVLVKKMFWDLPQDGKDGTTNYLKKACMKILPFDNGADCEVM